MHLRQFLPLLFALVFLSACGEYDSPVRIGLVAGVSGGNADLGQADSPYLGLQQTLKIDGYGDSRPDSHFVIVQGAEFVPAP